MLKLLINENLDHHILRGLRLRRHEIDAVTVPETGMQSAEDPDLLEWAAKENRVIVTHDVNTMTKYAKERIEAKLPMAGVCVIPDSLPVGKAIDELEIVGTCSTADEWHNLIIYLPL